MASMNVRRKRHKRRAWEQKKIDLYQSLWFFPTLEKISQHLKNELFPAKMCLDWPVWAQAYCELHELCLKTRRPFLEVDALGQSFMFQGCAIKPKGQGA